MKQQITLCKQTPMDQQANLDYQVPTVCVPTMGNQATVGHQATMGNWAHMGSQAGMESQAPMVNHKAVGSQTAMEEPTPMCPSTVVHVQASAATSKSNHEGEDNEVIKRQSSWPKRVPPRLDDYLDTHTHKRQQK